jgi:aromatic ring-cleaving dioxygenase
MGTMEIKGYHAHVYYDPASRAAAAHVREGLGQFNVELGRWHDEPVGPHLKSMYQVAFTADEFGKVVPWLMLNREGLDVLVHLRTGGDAAGDHLERSLWLGKKLELNMEVLLRAREG